MDFKTELVKALLPLAASALATLGALALAALTKLALAKANESALFKAMAVLPHAAEAVWADVAPSLEKELADDAADGQLTKDELDTLKAHAVAMLKASLAKNGLSALKDAFGPLLDGFLSKKIDAAAAAAKPMPIAAVMPPTFAPAASPK